MYRDTALSNTAVNTFDDEYESAQIELSQNDLAQAVVTGSDWTTETVLNQIQRGNIKLNPSFQRRDAWTQRRKSQFIESLMLGLPIPQIVLAEEKGHRGRFLVLDGKQRLLALQQFAIGSSLDPVSDEDTAAFALKDLEVLPQLNGKKLSEIEDDIFSDRILDGFLNQTIRTVVVRNWPNEDYLHVVFLRLNTGSVQLSPQELRQALHPGEFTNYLDEFSAECTALQESLGNSEPDFRMRDVEITLRYLAFDFFLEDYRGNLKKFLDSSLSELNKRWLEDGALIRERASQMEFAIEATKLIFGDDAFRSWSRDRQDFQGRFNRAVFDVMVYYFKDPQIRKAAIYEKNEVKSAFETLAMRDQSFVDSISSTTKTSASLANRIGRWGSALRTVLPEVRIPEVKLAGNQIIVN